MERGRGTGGCRRTEDSRHGKLAGTFDVYSWPGSRWDCTVLVGWEDHTRFVVTFCRSEHMDLCSTLRWNWQPQLEHSSDNRIILPFHTLNCFSLNYNCFLHNNKKKTCSRVTQHKELLLTSFANVAEDDVIEGGK